MKYYSIALLVLISCLSIPAAQTNAAYEILFSSGARLGMRADQLFAARKGHVLPPPFVTDYTNRAEFICAETNAPSPFTHTMYIFKQGHLRAIVLSGERKQAEHSSLIDGFAKSFTSAFGQPTATNRTVMDSGELIAGSVRRWSRDGMVVQLINPLRRRTLAVFDPLYVDGESFFPTASQIVDRQRQKERLELERQKRLK